MSLSSIAVALLSSLRPRCRARLRIDFGIKVDSSNQHPPGQFQGHPSPNRTRSLKKYIHALVGYQF